MKIVICVVGFGDDVSMFDNFFVVYVVVLICFCLINFLGFGVLVVGDLIILLEIFVDMFVGYVIYLKVDIVLVYLVVLVIVLFVVSKVGFFIEYVILFEGNLICEDVYFFGIVVVYDFVNVFRIVFFVCFDDMVIEVFVIVCYCKVVE